VALAYAGRDVEVFFVVDKTLQRSYGNDRELRQEIDYVISEVTSFYDTLNLGIKIYKRDLEFLNRDMGYTTDANVILDNFRKWLKNGRKFETLKYDMAILLTGHDLTDGGDSVVAGLAGVSTVCTQNAAGIAEMRKSYFATSTVAHEMAHILGSRHDRDPNPGYIMASVGSPSAANRWSFSYESKNYIRNHIKNKNCFKDKSYSSKYITGVKIPSKLRNPNAICKRLHGSSSGLGCNTNTKGGDSVCSSIMCKSGGRNCQGVQAYDGMTCGNRKSCKKGRCVSDYSAPAVPDNCPFGDADTVYLGGRDMSCPSVVSQHGKHQCEQGWMKKKCCVTCAGGGSGGSNNNGNGNGGGSTGCARDRSYSCRYYTASRSFCRRNGAVCCKLCAGYRKKRDVDLAEDIGPDVATEVDAILMADSDVIVSDIMAEDVDSDMTVPDVMAEDVDPIDMAASYKVEEIGARGISKDGAP